MTEYERSGTEMSEIRKALGTKDPDAKGSEENIRVQKVRICLFSLKLVRKKRSKFDFFPKMVDYQYPLYCFFYTKEDKTLARLFR
jgi:hypothetical protein